MKNYSNKQLIEFASKIDEATLAEDDSLRLAIIAQFGCYSKIHQLAFGNWLARELALRMEMREIAEEINEFLMLYGRRAADDPEYFNSGDANWLMGVAKLFANGIHEFRWVGSSYMHGGYKKGGEEMHDIILGKISNIQKKYKLLYL
jgi:hypothetical protein